MGRTFGRLNSAIAANTSISYACKAAGARANSPRQADSAHLDCIKNQLNFTAHGVSFMETQKERERDRERERQRGAAKEMMKTSKVAKHEMATKIIFSQALGVCAELRT